QQSTNLYSYATEGFHNIPAYARVAPRTITYDEWYTAPNLRFRLVRNPNKTPIELDNVVVRLSTVNATVRNLIATIGVEFDKEINSIMIISKQGYNLNGTVNCLNKSVDELTKKRLVDKSIVDKNTEEYLRESMTGIREKLDSAAQIMNHLRVTEGLYDIKDRDEKSLALIKDLETRKADLVTKIN